MEKDDGVTGELTLREGGNLSKTMVKQSHDILRAAARLKLPEKRLINAAIGRLNMPFKGEAVTAGEKVNGGFIRITAGEYAELYGVSVSVAYRQLKESFNSLLLKIISFKAGQYTRKTQWLWDGGYHDGQGYVDILLSATVVEHCRDIQRNFTLYPLSQAGQLRLECSLPIYALLAKFHDTGLVRMTLEAFCDEINAPPSYRSKVTHLKQKAIEPSLLEIKERLGLKVTYTLQKVGRSYEKIELRFDPANWKNQQQELKLKPDNTRSSSDTKENRKRVTAAVMDIEDTNW